MFAVLDMTDAESLMVWSFQPSYLFQISEEQSCSFCSAAQISGSKCVETWFMQNLNFGVSESVSQVIFFAQLSCEAFLHFTSSVLNVFSLPFNVRVWVKLGQILRYFPTNSDVKKSQFEVPFLSLSICSAQRSLHRTLSMQVLFFEKYSYVQN